MPRVELALAAVEDLADLIDSHELPGDTWPRVVRSLRPLEHEAEDRVVVVTIQDGRTSTSATSGA